MNELKKSTISNEYISPFELRKFVEVLLSEAVRGNKEEAARLTRVDKGKFYYYGRISRRCPEKYRIEKVC